MKNIAPPTRRRSKPSKPASGSSRSTTSCDQGDKGRAVRLLEALRARARLAGVRAAVRGDDAVHQHDCAARAGAVSGRPRHRAPHQEPGALERAGDGRPRQSRVGRHRRPHLDVRVGGDAVRSGVQPLLPRQGRRRATPTSSTSRATRRPGIYARALPRRPDHRRAPAEFPPRAAAGRRAVVLSASVADAGLLGVPDGLDGPRPAAWRSTRRASSGTSRTAASRSRPIRRSGRSSATARPTSPKRSARSRWPPARSSTT